MKVNNSQKRPPPPKPLVRFVNVKKQISPKTFLNAPQGIQKSSSQSKKLVPRLQKISNKKNDDSIRSSSTIDDIVSTGTSVAKVVASLAEGNPLGLLEVPNTVMKVIDTTKNIINNVSKSTATEKVVLKNNTDIKSVENTVLINKLSEHMPVITTTQIPSSYSTEYSQPPLDLTPKTLNGRNILGVKGSYALAPYYNEATVGQLWNYAVRMTPNGGTVFGPRVSSIASTYQMYRINSVTATTVPTIGTDYSGNLYLNFNEGTDIAGQYSSAITYQHCSQRECAQPGSLKLGTNLTYRGKGDWLYCYNSSSTSDLKFFSSATFGLLTFNYVASTPIRLGIVLLTFDIDMMAASESTWAFFDTMNSMFRSIWLQHCRLNISYDVWAKVVWNVSNYLLKNKRDHGKLYEISKMAQREDQLLIQSYADAKREPFKARYAGKFQEMKIFQIPPTTVVFGFEFLNETFFGVNEIKEHMAKAGMPDLYLEKFDDIFPQIAFRQLLALITLYFDRVVHIEDGLRDFQLRLIKSISREIYQGFHPKLIQDMKEPQSSSDEEDEEDELIEQQ
jgi:hypothetical protein